MISPTPQPLTSGHLKSRRGSVLLVVLPVALAMASLGAALLMATTSDSNASNTADRLQRADRLAHAGALRAVAEIEAALINETDIPLTAGTRAVPRSWGTGAFWADITTLSPGVYAVDARGRSGRHERRVQAVVEKGPSPIYDYAIFAGNRSADLAYSLRLSGVGSSADTILGSVYSAGDVVLDDDASVTGSIRSTGTITGATGTEGVSEVTPDIAAMDYGNEHDYDVAALFATSTYGAAPSGGDADQLPASNPAHIFRRNPSDRTSRTSATTKDDYFLEDPLEAASVDSAMDGSNPSIISLSGDSGEDKVFYIDGNLWLDNAPEYSFRFENDNGEPVRVTFVVRGNIIFGDNLYYNDPANDAVAFVAIEDPAVPDSGNILFGDESGGTLNHMSAFMYAENDFVDHHLDATGSADVTLNGNMTAGDQVVISRDFVDGSGDVFHSKLTIDFDDRISNGTVSLAGLPGADPEDRPMAIRMWRHAGVADDL